MSKATLTNCDREPIHTPGAVQPFGALVVLNAKTLKIQQVSANAQSFLGEAPEALLGQDAERVFGPDISVAIAAKVPRVRTASWTAALLYREQTLLVEVERTDRGEDARPERSALDRLAAATSLQDLLDTAVRAVAKVSGLDRVMAYRFHEDLHGEVLAEHVKPGVESYLGLHYPATDIPSPARAVFLRSWVRMIPDVGAAPVPLVPTLDPQTGRPLDLGDSLLRAVSPIHIDYLKNMRVGASLTISLIADGKLWGLIAAHALGPCTLSPERREACEAIGRVTSAYLSVKDDLEKLRLRESFRAVQRRLVERLHSSNDMAVELTQHSPNLLDLIRSSGTAAALYLDGYWVTLGEAPTHDQLERIIDWLIENHPDEPVYATPSLAKEFPDAQELSAVACGLLALSIPKSPRNYVLWFRPEFIRTVTWAGNPEKTPDATGRLHPRSSFAVWAEEVRGRSQPWTELEIEAALELRNGVMAADLQRQFLKEQAARQEAERAVRAREELMAVLSHDLKNPIGSIKLVSKVATKFLRPETIEKVKEHLERIDRAATNMNSLINDILAITKLEAGHLDMEKKLEPIDVILMEVCDLLTPLANEKGIQLRTNLAEVPCHAECDRAQVLQVFSNLIGNAIKFSPNDTEIQIGLESCGPEFVKISVQDEGPGVNPGDLHNIFDRYWQAKQTRRLGTGLGLAIAKGVVTAHGGEIWAESDGKRGTTFFVTFPISTRLTPAKRGEAEISVPETVF